MFRFLLLLKSSRQRFQRGFRFQAKMPPEHRRHLSNLACCNDYSSPAPRAHLYLAPSTSTGNSVE